MPPDPKLTDAFLEGLKQDSADPDAADERFMAQAAAIDDEDRTGPPALDGTEEDDEDDEEDDDVDG